MEEAGYKRIARFTRHEIRIKRSRFIGTAAPAPDREAAEAFLERIRKEFHDATHNCFAYRITPNEYRFSDDGEPAGTAGRPILLTLEKHQLVQTVVVVTRYFGGIKLGTGGLARAYSQCAEETLQLAPREPVIFYDQFRLRFPYPLTGTVQQTLQRLGSTILNSIYGSDVTLEVAIPKGTDRGWQHQLREAAAGNIEIQEMTNGNTG